MRKAAIAFLAAAISLGAVGMLQAADPKRMQDVGSCLAFSYVNNGLDGQREVPKELLNGILALKDEFMFEASINGLDDNAAQTYVVEQLTEQNRVKELKGIEVVREKYLDLCAGIAEDMAAATRKNP
jgi:hypothetical protein